MLIACTLALLCGSTYLVLKNHQLNWRVLQTLRLTLVEALTEAPEDLETRVHSHVHDSLWAYLALRARARQRLWVGWSLYGLGLLGIWSTW